MISRKDFLALCAEVSDVVGSAESTPAEVDEALQVLANVDYDPMEKKVALTAVSMSAEWLSPQHLS